VADSLASEGFIHLSTDRQWVKTANRFYVGQGDLVLLEIREDKLTSAVRYEAADGDEFPHLFGALDLDAVLRVIDLTPCADGTFKDPRA
jgi:uncharacterized protein (DUF952 family)